LDLDDEEIMLAMHVIMAKSRDKIFIEQGISDEDVDISIKKHKLERDPDFGKLMQAHQKSMKTTLDKYKTAKS
jgi:hypothetical protein